MTQEEMQKMTRKEWRAYNKRMKALDWKYKKSPQHTTLEEIRELTDWHWERARRFNEAAKVPEIISIIGWSVTFICLIIKLILVVTGR